MELETLTQAAKAAHDAATNEESKAEDQYDTRGLEASYLAGAQAQRAAEIQRQILIYKFLPLRDYGPEDVIAHGAVAGLELNGRVSYYFLVPQGGGLVLRFEDKPVQVITPQSPLGDAILGLKLGDPVEVEVGGQNREYKVVSIQ